jgi:hypothetical protein
MHGTRIKIPGTHFCQRLSRPQGHKVVGGIKSMKNPNYSTENRACDLTADSVVPQPTAWDGSDHMVQHDGKQLQLSATVHVTVKAVR